MGKAKCVAVDEHLYGRCKEQNLFEAFAGLKGGDLIYACIAKLEGLPLVTCDGDFDKVVKDVQVMRINK